MTKEEFKKIQDIQSAITFWEDRRRSVAGLQDPVSLDTRQAFSIGLNDEEIQKIKDALLPYYDSKLAPLKEEFDKL